MQKNAMSAPFRANLSFRRTCGNGGSYMKKRLLRATALTLVLVIMSLAFTGCASSKVYKLTDGEYGTYFIREDEYKYFLGYYKATIIDSLSQNTDFSDTDDYWNQELDSSYQTLFGVKTYSEMYELMYRSTIEQAVTTYLFCQLLFDQYGLEDTDLWKKYEDNVSSILFTILTYYGLSTAQLNAYGKECGISYDLLKRVYTLQAKASCVQEYLYGTNGEKIDPAFLEEFYHGSDALKQEGYLGYMAYKPISIHTERGIEETVDEDGNVSYSVVTLSTEEKERKELLAKEIRTLLGMKGGFEGDYDYQILRGDETFDELYDTYSEDKTYDIVYALATTSASNYTLLNSLTLTEIGGYAEAPLSYTLTTSSGAVEISVGVEIAQRVELEDKAYEMEEYELFFQNFYSTASTIQFYQLLQDKMTVYGTATKYNSNRTSKMTICGSDANVVDYPIMTGKYDS